MGKIWRAYIDGRATRIHIRTVSHDLYDVNARSNSNECEDALNKTMAVITEYWYNS